ncbi:MAG TPA: hypothetical protein VJ992_03070 [Gemmatimonadales bacterium]|nr:hypothetical protein [Gemmatimonadales bacterium]
MFGRMLAVGTVLAATVTLAAPAQAQQTEDLPAVVVEIAGDNVYLNVGRDQGIAAHDTLVVLEDSTTTLGRVQVLAVTSTRALVAFLGRPLALTRGTSLIVRRAVGPAPAAAPVAAAPASTATPRFGRVPNTGPVVSGQLSLDVDASQAQTRWLTSTWQSASQRFATPTAGLRLNVSNLPGGFRLETDLRAAYRYSSAGIIDPTQTVHVYDASLVKTFGRAPLEFRLGRFFNPYSVYTGFFDGFLAHVGDHGLGAGFAVGFEPDAYSQGFSTTLPKYAGFVNLRLGGVGAGYDADLSIHQVRPTNGFPIRTTAGWSQALTIGGFRASSDLELDRIPASGWTLTRFQARLSARLARGVSLFGRVGRNGPWIPYDTTTLTLGQWRQDQASLGLSFWGSGGSATFNVNGARLSGGTNSYGASMYLSRSYVSWLGVGLNASGSYWTGDAGTTIQASGGLDRPLGGGGDLRLTYAVFRTTTTNATVLTHSGDATLSIPIARRTFFSFGARGRWGANLRGLGLHTGLWVSF